MPAADERALPACGNAVPLSRDEIDQRFAPLADFRQLGLAVSGGADSMAMMHVAAEWTRAGRSRPSLHVLTVDHGLRATSAKEACGVVAAARRLGLAASVLVWEGAKPASALAARARAARYRLIAEAACLHALDAVATAHTLDDQAETLLMRLARGSGLDGLSGIPARVVRDGVIVVRPLLAVSHERLVATLQARGLTWVEDPSNADERFERARVRALRATLDRLGVTAPAIAESARRLARARVAIEAAVEAALKPSTGLVQTSDFGAAALDWARLTDHPAEIRLRVMARLIEAVAAPPEPVSMRRLEALTEARGWQKPIGRTLAGAAFLAGSDGRLLIVREIARRPPPRLTLQAGATVLWDRRFRLSSAISAAPVEVGVLGAAGLAALESAGFERPRIPARVLWALPACRDVKEQIVAVPSLGYGPGGANGYACRFMGCIA